MKAKKVAPKKPVPVNRLFPGRPHYTGPDRGWFAWVHHGKLFEHTKADGDSIADRVVYVKTNKPADERAIRLAHIMYLGPSLNRKLDLLRKQMHGQGFGYSGMFRYQPAVSLVKTYIARHKPKNWWNDDKSTLMKVNDWPMTG